MVKTGRACAIRGKESQIDAERSDDRLCMSRSTTADLIQDDFPYRCCIVLADIAAERWQHSCDQAFVALYSRVRQSPMAQKPISEGAEGRRSFGGCSRNRGDDTLFPQIGNEALHTCR